jgi:hypothetical protein
MCNIGGHHFCDNAPPYPCYQDRRSRCTHDLDFDQYSAPSRLSSVHQVEEVDVLVYDTAVMLFGGIVVIDDCVMSMLDLRAPDSTRSHYDDL